MSHRPNDPHLSEERLQAFLDGALSRRERAIVEEHLGSCARCSAEFGAWKTLFADLGGLHGLRPHEGFADRVMLQVRVPEPRPLPQRIGERASALLGLGASGHLDDGIAQDLVEGLLPRRDQARVRRHLETCGSCAHQVERWGALTRKLDGLPSFGPSPRFADTVMSRVTMPERVASRDAARVASVSVANLLGRAARLVPRSRRAWAALSGAAITPLVTLGLVVYAVFSSPALTPGALVSYAWWQLGDLAAAAWSAGLGIASGLVSSAGLQGLAGTLGAAAPAALAAAAAVYSLLLVLAFRVLYKNLVTARGVEFGHVRIGRS